MCILPRMQLYGEDCLLVYVTVDQLRRRLLPAEFWWLPEGYAAAIRRRPSCGEDMHIRFATVGEHSIAIHKCDH